MSHSVSLKVTSRDELSMTLIASERSLACVRSNVRLQVSCLLEFLQAALIWTNKQLELTF